MGEFDEIRRIAEDVYDKAMQVGLRLAGLHYEGQKVVELARNMLLSQVHSETAGALGGAAKVVSRFGSRSLEARLASRLMDKVVPQILSRAGAA